MRVLLSIVMMLLVTTALRAETRQQRWIGDVPVMPGMEIETDLGFAFDSPDGRIVVIYASGQLASSDLAKYYDMALPPLGWKSASTLVWTREGEQMMISSAKASGTPLWKITIMPR